MATGLDAIDEIDLSKLTPEGKPKKPSRLSDPSAIRSMYRQAVNDDQGSATVRAQLQACKDGAPPFNQAALNASGQGSRANFNTLMMQDLITKANHGFNDIIFSPKQLMTIEVEGGEPSERLGYSRILATELSRTIRRWGPSFSARTQRLIDLFVSHGAAIDYAQDDRDFRFQVAALDEFLVPRQVEVSAEQTPWAIARKDLTVTELYDYIEDEKAAAKLGWNVQAVKDAIGRSTTQVPTGEIGDTAKLQQQVKNNDLFANTMFSHVPVLYFWVREFDGTYSMFITEKDAPKGDFLFKQYSRYETVEDAFNYYTYGIGNGTLHSVRGLGHMIFALCQMHSRLMCQKADGVMLSESIMMQATSSNAMQEASLTYLGPIALMPQGFEVVERQFQGGSDKAMGFLGEIKQQMGQVSGRHMPPSKQGGEQYRNRDEVSSDLENAASGDSGSLDLFFSAWDITIRRMCKRIIKGSKSSADRLVAEFHRRIERAGITKDILDSIDHDSTYAYRTLGAGSPAARSLSFTKLMSLLPQLDEIGRKNLIYQFVANEVGYQNADEFASKAEEPRYNSEASIALLENEILMMGRPVQVLSYQMHGTHVQMHVPPLLEVLGAVERGELDPMENLPGLQASLNHLAAHGEELARDPSQLALYGQVKEAVNNTQQVVTNMERKIKAIQAQGGGEAEAAAPGGEDALNAEKVRQEQLKTAMIEFKLEIAQRKGEMELAIQQAKADQNLALNDLKGAEMVQKKMQYPQSDYSSRR